MLGDPEVHMNSRKSLDCRKNLCDGDDQDWPEKFSWQKTEEKWTLHTDFM